jgi:hypothetical protein
VQDLLSFSLLSKNIKTRNIQNCNVACCFYGYEAWSLTFRQELSLKVLGNRVQRKMSGPKRDEVTADWRRLHNEELCSSNSARMIKSRKMRWAGYVALMGGRRGGDRGLVARPDGKKRLGRLRWEGNIKVKLQVVEGEGMDWIAVAQDRDWWRALVNAIMNLLVP